MYIFPIGIARRDPGEEQVPTLKGPMGCELCVCLISESGLAWRGVP